MTKEVQKSFEARLMQAIIDLALEEDKVYEDITTNSLLEFDREVTAAVTAKEDGIISGTEVFIQVFHTVDPEVSVEVVKGSGSAVSKGDIVFKITGKESSILKAERPALNFLQRLSGIATMTRAFTTKLQGLPIELLDTRKTTPGMRYLEKQAVLDGGGSNHRLNLEDMAMIKDNHIEMAGSIAKAVQAVKSRFPAKQVEVEVRNLEELKEALEQDIDIIMLDNFSPELQKEAVKITAGRVKLEVSGNVTLENINKKAVEGIDYISVGALTHSFKSLDLSLGLVQKPVHTEQ
jgi:nicotinate-nucleotide pyrophosphorylase